MLVTNVGGIRNSEKQEVVLESCDGNQADINILIESLLENKHLPQIKNKWLGQVLISQGSEHTSGIIVLLRPGFPDVTDIQMDSKGRFLSFRIPSLKDIIICTYAP